VTNHLVRELLLIGPYKEFRKRPRIHSPHEWRWLSIHLEDRAMIALKRILFPTDFSENVQAAQKYACALAEQFHAELHLLHVMVDPAIVIPEPGTFFPIPDTFLAELKERTEKALDGALDATWCAGKTVQRVIRRGTPFVEIVRYAKDVDADLIVIGTHGRGGLAHVLLGSVAEKVVRKAPCPVLTVRPAGHHFVMP
jgi:nucleotide-binding universal stress UspA family protein